MIIAYYSVFKFVEKIYSSKPEIKQSRDKATQDRRK